MNTSRRSGIRTAAIIIVLLLAAAAVYLLFFRMREDNTPKTPPDLNGEWIQVKSEELEYYHIATVHDGMIEVSRYRPAYDDSELIWIGTYIPPETAEKRYTWDSENQIPRRRYTTYTLRYETLTFIYDGEEDTLNFAISYNPILKMMVTMERHT